MAAVGMEEDDHAFVQKALDLLGEHFDTVQIFCTRHEGGECDGTVAINKGVGNWFARRGQVREWMLGEDKAIPQRTTIIDDDAD